jgi:tetratricopeptide (TPR) repeat protein
MGDRRDEADNLGNLASLAFEQGHLKRAAEMHAASLKVYSAIGDRRGQANEMCNIAYVAEARDQFEDAQQLFADALSLYRDLDSRYGEAHALIGLATIAHRHRDNQQAKKYYLEALDSARATGDPEPVRIAFTNLGLLCEIGEDWSQAARWYAQAVETIEVTRSTLAEEKLQIAFFAQRVNPFERLALVHFRLKDLGATWHWCERARSRAFLDLLRARVDLQTTNSPDQVEHQFRLSFATTQEILSVV